MRLELLAAIVGCIASASLVQAASAPNEDLALSIAQLSGKSCYGIASGEISMPAMDHPGAADEAKNVIKGLGLTFGLHSNIMDKLGNPGFSMVARSIMGSKACDQGDLVLAVAGSQPGCRVILLSEPNIDVTEAVSTNLFRSDWKPLPSMTTTFGPVQRRAFLRRDGKGSSYLMNLMTVTNPMASSKVRLFTTTIRVPDGVQLPEGL